MTHQNSLANQNAFLFYLYYSIDIFCIIISNLQMYYAVPSGIVFGGFMYYLGRIGVIDPQHFHHHHKKHQQQKPTTKTDSTATTPLETTKTFVNSTFSPQAITPIIRTIELNPQCRILYSTLHKAPLSVHQILDLQTITGQAQRAKSFHKETTIQPQKFAVGHDTYLKSHAYRKLHLSRGHMSAASNFSSTQQLKNSTFSFANTIPQNYSNNSGIWNTFQRYARNLLKDGKCENIEIVSGPIYYSGNKVEGMGEIYLNEEFVLGKNGVIVPPKLYKIIKCNTKSGAYASAFTFKNDRTFDNQKNLSQFEQPIQEIENQTGLVFNFKDQIKAKLSQFDFQGLNAKKVTLDKQYFGNLFNSAVTTSNMNDALRRAYQQNLSMQQQKLTLFPKIQNQASIELSSILSNPQTSECRKILLLMQLHKNLFYLSPNATPSPSPSHSALQSEISSSIHNLLFLCRDKATLNQQSQISYKIAGSIGKKYQYPYQQLISKLFPRETEGAHPDIAPRGSNAEPYVGMTDQGQDQGNNRQL